VAENGQELTREILAQLHTLNKNAALVFTQIGRHDERLNSHGRALKWLFGILASVVVLLIGREIGAK